MSEQPLSTEKKSWSPSLKVLVCVSVSVVLIVNIVWPGKPSSASIHIDAKWDNATSQPSVNNTEKILIELLKLTDSMQNNRTETEYNAESKNPVPTSKPVTSQPSGNLNNVYNKRDHPATPTSLPSSRPSVTANASATKPIAIVNANKIDFAEYDDKMYALTEEGVNKHNFSDVLGKMSEITLIYSGYRLDPTEDVLFPFWKNELRKHLVKNPTYKAKYTKFNN